MRSHVGCTGNIVLLGAPQEPNVMCLQDQDNDPVYACDHRIDTEASGMVIVLAPYCVTVLVFRAVAGLCKGIHGAKDDQHKPGKDGEDLVGEEVSLGEFLALGEWIICREVSVIHTVGGSSLHTICESHDVLLLEYVD